MTGTLSILNVGDGDTKITFDGNNQAELIRSKRVITDMLRRGYALLIEVERDGEKAWERVLEFRENTFEYVIADLDPVEAQEADANEARGPRLKEKTDGKTRADEPPAPKPRKTGRGRRTTVSAEGRHTVAVGRSAGG